MIQMRGADAYFLLEESRARHMHTLKVVVVDPSTAHEKLTFERMRARAPRVLPHLPVFRRRAVRIPLGLGQPLWIDAPTIDTDYHLRHEVLPPGAGEDAFDELLGRLASEPLDRDRPLWQIFFVEGLPGGRIAYVTKLHHALADGPASAEIVVRSFQQNGGPVALPKPYEGGNESVPSAGRRIAYALRRNLTQQREIPTLLKRSVKGLRLRRAWQRAGRRLPAKPFTSPPTLFNHSLTPNRVFAHVKLPLQTLRDVKRRFDCSLNDVYLAVAGGALRGYLERHGEPSRRPLTAAVPVSVRREQDDPIFGNATAFWFASTGSHVDDPVERLRLVIESTRAARELFEARDPRLPIDWLDHWSLRRLYLDGLAIVGRALVGRPSYNVIVSNVRGPSRPLYNNGARVEELYSMGPLALQQGLNLTAWSYLNDFSIGVHACREYVPDVRSLADALPVELEKLRRETEPRAS